MRGSLLCHLAAAQLERGMLLLGSRGGRAALGLERLVRLERRRELGGAGALGLQIAPGDLVRRIRPGQLIGKLLAPQAQLPGTLAGGGVRRSPPAACAFRASEAVPAAVGGLRRPASARPGRLG